MSNTIRNILSKDLIATALAYVYSVKSNVVGMVTIGGTSYNMTNASFSTSNNWASFVGTFTSPVSGTITSVSFIVYDNNNLAAIDMQLNIPPDAQDKWAVAKGVTYTIQATFTWSWRV